MDTQNTASQGFLRNRFGESYLPDVNRRDFDTESSSGVFERRLTIDFEADDTLFVVVGSDSGLLSEYLRARPLGKGSRRLLIESDDLHALIAPRSAPGTQAAELHRFSDWDTALRECNPGGYTHGGRIELVESLGCLHDQAGVYVPILRRIRSDLATLVHRRSIEVSGQDFIRKQLHNACENRLPVSLLRDVGAGHTAVVLGGGPSLDDSIDWIVEHRESLFLIAASRLCGKLQRLGIRPDVVVAVDPQSGMYDLSKEGLLWSTTLLVHSFHVAPQLLHQWRGPRLYFGELHPWVRRNEEEGGNFPCLGPTVSHTAVWLAHCWSFDRILMCGVDMCYSIGGGSHASDSVESLLGSLPSQCDASVRTYAGRLAGTGRSLEFGLECLEDLGRRVNADAPRLFNTSADAARVASVPLIDLDTVEPDVPRPKVILPPAQPSSIEHLRRVRRDQTDATRRFGTIGRRCKEAIRLLDGMDAAPDEASFDARRRRLDRLEKSLGKEHGPWYDTIKQYASDVLLATVKPSGFGDEETQRQDWGRQYYRTIGQVSKLFIELLQACDERTSMRLEELADEPDIDALLAYWSKDMTPGRVLGLSDRLASCTPAAVTKRVALAAEVFLATLGDGETEYAELIREFRLSPGNLMRNLAFMFREGVAADLALLADRMLALDSPYDLFAHYSAGLHAELDGDVEAALNGFQRVIDRFGEWLGSSESVPEGFEPLLEDTLQHVVQCYLGTGDGESAVATLALLVQLSPLYVPQYARLLHLLGRHTEALETLECHMERSPEDWRTLLQIADIYTALGSRDAAEMAKRLAAEARASVERTDLAA